VHSGLHKGGAPKYPDMHEHTATPLTCLHWLFGPHGDGAHGLITSTDAEIIYKIYSFILVNKQIIKTKFFFLME